MKSELRKVIQTNGTFTLISETCYVRQVVIVINNAGSSWLLAFKDRGSPQMILVPGVPVSAPSAVSYVNEKFDDPLGFTGGIDISTSGATPGYLSIWISIEKGEG